jgi:hypothetical protein
VATHRLSSGCLRQALPLCYPWNQVPLRQVSEAKDQVDHQVNQVDPVRLDKIFIIIIRQKDSHNENLFSNLNDNKV